MSERLDNAASIVTDGRVLWVQQAFRLEWITVAWMVIEAVVAIGSGLAAHSLTLLAFGADSVIELLSAFLLLWRLTVELQRGERFSEAAEQRASKIGGALLFALALYVVASAVWGLWTRAGQDFSLPGLIVSALAIPIMYVLAKTKRHIAAKIGSRALRADAIESVTCGYLSVAVVAGLMAQLLVGAWWVDSVTSLAIVGLLVKEGREAWAGEDCCHDD